MIGSIQPAGESPRGKGKPSRSNLDGAPCAPMDREKLARLIWNVLIDWHAETDAPAYSIADALIAAGLRLPGAAQPDAERARLDALDLCSRLDAVMLTAPRFRGGVCGQTTEAMARGTFHEVSAWNLDEAVSTIHALLDEIDRLTAALVAAEDRVAAMESPLRGAVLPLLRRVAEDLLRCVSVNADPATISGSDWRDIAADMEAVLAVEALVGRPYDQYGRVLDLVLDSRPWEAHR